MYLTNIDFINNRIKYLEEQKKYNISSYLEDENIINRDIISERQMNINIEIKFLKLLIEKFYQNKNNYQDLTL